MRAEPGSLLIRPAGSPDELASAALILEEAAAWMAERGVDGWEPGTFRSPGGSGWRLLEEAMAAGTLHLAWDEAQAVATMTLQWRDEPWWPGAPEDAGYVHRFAVRSDHRGAGVGARFLAWAEETALSCGKSFLRLDCARRDGGIRRYYERAGFRHRGDPGGRGSTFEVSLYEKALG